MKMSKQIAMAAGVLLLSGGVVALMLVFRRHTRPQPVEFLPPLVSTQAVLTRSYQVSVPSQGTVKATTAIRLISQVDGNVIRISPALAKGGVVRRGDLLVTIEPKDFDLAVTRAEAQVASARLKRDMAQAEAEIALRDWQDLGGERPASPLLLKKPQLNEAVAALAAAQADLEKARLDLSRTRIRAPFDGRVIDKEIDIGQFVRRGEELASLFSIERVEVRLPLPLDELAYLDLPEETGKKTDGVPPLRVVLRGRFAGEEREWHGRVVRVDGEIDSRSRMGAVIAEVRDPFGMKTPRAAPLKPGMFVSAEIAGHLYQNVHVVPRVAFYGRDQVLVVDRESRLRFRKVDVVRSTQENIIVRSGFQPGDRICVSLVEAPHEGMVVRTAQESGGSQS